MCISNLQLQAKKCSGQSCYSTMVPTPLHDTLHVSLYVCAYNMDLEALHKLAYHVVDYS